ncbi:hypothetical protein [Solidesulfovibrio magneticus]|uniref:DUF3828 domain-containing protein n=1 Tax=Solidesulfovibrio magneticus (strain ATCC 700980 / DSM 13731 / RS-1) TaxID=573370 RepID=C4XS56_SOLM1|nr:hypothetical protein [Solidesulfovibrio magneticus]BAH75578.1 hypothetical protein DMR_20870 [Solidesulfovibrio magneticus RS-1]
MGKWFGTMVLAMLFTALGGAVAFAGPPVSAISASYDADKPAAGRPHPAATEAEKALDKLLRLSEKRVGLVAALLGRPGGGKGEAALARELTTVRLRHDLSELERKAVRDNCKGRYIPGELCGLDYNPLTCAQDESDAPYSYRTTAATADRSDITYSWPGSAAPSASFVMVREAGVWKLDAARCLP